MSQSPPRTDVVVIGCSAGGVEALPRIVQQLPSDFDASVFIVQHLSPTRTPYLVDILNRSSALPVSWAEQGERVSRYHIYVAPPDVHLIFADDHMVLAPVSSTPIVRRARCKHSHPIARFASTRSCQRSSSTCRSAS